MPGDFLAIGGDKMRVLMVGLGDIARKAYLPVLALRTDVELHLASRNRAVLDDVGRAFRLPHRYSNIDEALAATAFDAAFVHAATAAHPELVRILLGQGIPTFVDKPLADNLTEAETLIELASRKATPLVVGFNRRFAPGYLALRGMDASLITMEKHRHRLPDLSRRVVFDDFIHVVDTLLFLVPGKVRRRTIETDIVDGLLRVATVTLAGEGFIAFGAMHRDSGLDEERLDLIGGGARRTVLNLSDRADATGIQQLRRRDDWTSVGRQRGFEAMCDDFLKAARDRKPVDAAAILQTHELCEAIVRHADARSSA